MRIALPHSVFRVFLAAIFLLSSVSIAETSADLERILAECGSLHAFLGSAPHQARYYQALRDWIKVDEQQFPRETFDLIIRETSRLVGQNPDLEKRLWSAEGLGKAFVVKIPEIAPPDKFVTGGWQTYLEDWRKGLREKAASIKNRTEAEQILAGLDADATKLAGGGERAARVGLAKLLEGVRRDANRGRIEAAAAFLVLDTLAKGRGAQLEAGVVAEVKDIFAKLSGSELSHGARLVARDMLPKVDSLRAQIGLAQNGPGRQSGREIRFDPLPRRFHGIWKGIKYNECVGGGCGWNGDLTARRLLTVALNGTEMHELTENGNHLGFTHHVPIIRNSDKAVFGSAEFISPLFGQVFSVERAGKVVEVPFTEMWFGAYDAAKPAAWKGLVKSRSLNIHNAGVLAEVMSSPSHRYAPSAGMAETDFTHGDVDFAQWVVGSTRVTERVHNVIGNDMVYDASIAGAGDLRIFSHFDERELTDLGRMRQVWQTLSPADRADRLVSWLQHAENRTEIRDYLRALTQQVDHDRLKTALAKQCEAGMIDGARHLGLLPLTPKEIVAAVTSHSDWHVIRRNMGRSAVTLVGTIVAKGATAEELGQLVHVIHHEPSLEKLAQVPGIKVPRAMPAAKLAAWLKGIAPRLKARKPGSAAEILNLLARPEAHGTEESAAMENFLLAHLEDFLHTRPTAEEFVRFRHNSTGIDGGIRLREKTMELAAAHADLGPRTPAEYLDWMKMEVDPPSDDYATRVREFNRSRTAWFAKLGPTIEQIHAFILRLPGTIDAGIQARDVILANHPLSASAEGYLQLVKQLRTSEHAISSQGYLDRLQAFADDKIDKFVSLNPSTDQVVKMLRELSQIDSCILLRAKYLAQRNPHSFTDLVALLKTLGQMENPNPSDGYRAAVSNFAAGHADRILATKPPPEQWNEVFSLIADAGAKRALRNRLLLAATPEEFARYFGSLNSDPDRAQLRSELLVSLLAANATEAQLKAYHDRLTTSETRAQVREQLISLAERRDKSASAPRIIAWLNFDRAAGDPIDPLPDRVRKLIEPGRLAQTWAAILCPFRKLLGR